MKCCPDCTHVPVYPTVDIIALAEHYTRHVSAMTEEGLHDKTDIAAQLAWRDKRIADLESLLATVTGNADGSLCRLPTMTRVGWCPHCHVKSARFVDGQCQSCGEPSK